MTQPSQRVVQDRYELLEPLGRGGMGVVWLAQDSVLQRKVAVKEVEIPPGVPADEIENLRARVMREARAAGRLNHPNVTTIFDVVNEGDTTWIVMEYVAAPTLTEIVSSNGPLSVQRAAAIGLGVLSALEAAHSAGIIHRDVKPGNVMVSDEGAVKLADFGVAAVQGDPKITMTGLIIGSPSYMAPEQAQEGVSTAASDIWGLGTTLYFAVEGRPAFDKGAAIPTLAAVSYEPPAPMSRAGALQPVLDRMLEKDPDRRPAAAELRSLLQDVAGAAEPTAVAAAPTTIYLDEPTAGAVAPEPAADEHWDDEPYELERRRSAWPWVLAALLLLGLAALTLPSLLDAGDETPVADADAPAEEPADEAAGGKQAKGDEPAAKDQPAQEEPAADRDPEPTAAAEPAGSVPGDWAEFSVGDTGSTVAHPQDWSLVERSATATDITDPQGGRYLRVDYTESPGDDAVEDWQRQSDSFADTHDDYEEIAITPYEYEGADTAGLWEYTYSDGGAELHAYNLAIVIGGRGYALNFQTRENQWADSQELWEQFVAGFEPAS